MNLCRLSREALALWLVIARGIELRFFDEFTVVRGEGVQIIEDIELDDLTAVFPSHVEVAKLAEVAQRNVAALIGPVGADVPVRLMDQGVWLRCGASVAGDARCS